MNQINNSNNMGSEIQKLKTGFENLCLFVLIKGYYDMISAKEYILDWPENQFTSNLVKFMEKLPETTTHKLDIIPEFTYHDADTQSGVKSADEAPRIDIRIMNWNQEKVIFVVEAKNLAENNWTKADGSEVNASGLRGRYINTGMDNFINERYIKGCLAGYVLEGDIDKIVDGINKLLKSKARNRASEIIKNKITLHGHPYCYESDHTTSSGTNSTLVHIFLKF